MSSRPALVRTRLSLMMFLEYFVLSAWAIPIGTYMAGTLKFAGSGIGWIYSTTAIGAIIAPLFVGYVADRLFATERILAVLHVIGGVCLVLAARAEPGQFPYLMGVMVVNAAAYMPTMALTNSLAFRNIPDAQRDFPIIRVWGTIGWIVAGLVVGIALGEARPWFFYLGGGVSLVLGLYSLTLPHTPPKGLTEGDRDVLGLRALRLLKERSFAVFTVAAGLVGVIASAYFGAGNLFLTETDAPVPTALQTLGQISEIFFMAAMPWFLARWGLKRVLLVGLAAWLARFLCFSSLQFPLVVLGLVLHGVCYDFFFVAAFIYVDKRAPQDLRASAQSFIAFVMMGVGQLLGTVGTGQLLDHEASSLTVAVAPGPDGSAARVSLPDWPNTEPSRSFWRYLDLKETIQEFVLDQAAQAERPIGLAERLGQSDPQRIVIASLEQQPEAVDIAGTRYSRQDLIRVCREVDTDGDGTITRAEWRAATGHHWRDFWLWPLTVALVTGVLLWAGFRDTSNETRRTTS
jgi:nucleoside transporter